MKKIVSLIALCALSFLRLSAQNVTIPDINLKAAFVNNPLINTSADTEIQVTEATAYSDSILISNLGIQNLTGIEAFVNIIYLSCYSNPLGIGHTTSELAGGLYFVKIKTAEKEFLFKLDVD